MALTLNGSEGLSGAYRQGEIIQVVAQTDAGSAFTATTMANRSAAFAVITPRSTNSKLLIECSFYGYAGAYAGGSNYINVQIYENNTTAIGSLYSNGSGGTGTSSQIWAGWTVRALVTNSALTSRNFSIWGANAFAPSSSGAINNCVWTITEIAA